MRVMRMCSGLGNTMFQYATYLQLKKMFPNEEIFIDTLWYDYTEEKDKFELERIFGIKLPKFMEQLSEEERGKILEKLDEYRYWKWNGYATRNEMLKKNVQLEKVSRTLTHEELPQLYRSVLNYNFRIISNEKMNHMSLKAIKGEENPYDENCKRNVMVSRLKNNCRMLFFLVRAIVNGNVRGKFFKDIFSGRKPDFTGTEKLTRLVSEGTTYYNIYGDWGDCDGVREELLRDLVFPTFRDDETENIQIQKQIEEKNSVSIHARVLDFEYGMGGILKGGYYTKAVKHIRKHVDNPAFFVFSDNIQWCKDNLEKLGLTDKDEIVFIAHNTGADSYKDMQLMSYCKHNVVPNSTFSWWGAYLNKNEKKIVVTPYATLPGTISF